MDTLIKTWLEMLSSCLQSISKLEKENRALKAQLSEQQVLLEKAEADARTDVLTGLPNRKAFQERITSEYSRARRFGENLSVLMFDVDFFKKVNDEHGHPTGDAVLKEIAKTVSSVVRASDLVARWGGEEFLLVMPNTHVSQAIVFAKRIRELVEMNDKTVRVTISVGVAGLNEGDEVEDLLRRVDLALYDAKRAGRNQVVVAG